MRNRVLENPTDERTLWRKLIHLGQTMKQEPKNRICLKDNLDGPIPQQYALNHEDVSFIK